VVTDEEHRTYHAAAFVGLAATMKRLTAAALRVLGIASPFTGAHHSVNPRAADVRDVNAAQLHEWSGGDIQAHTLVSPFFTGTPRVAARLT